MTMTLIHEYVGNSTLTTYTVTNIPQIYRDLVIFSTGTAVTSGSGIDSIRIQFNNDSNSNYSYNQFYNYLGNSPATVRNGSVSSIPFGYLAEASGSPLRPAYSMFYINNYSATTIWKQTQTQIYAAVYQEIHAGLWKNSNAVNSVTISTVDVMNSTVRIAIYGV